MTNAASLDEGGLRLSAAKTVTEGSGADTSPADITEMTVYRPDQGALTWWMTRCDRELVRRLDRLLRTVDLTDAQFGVLRALTGLHRASSATLARSVGVTPQAMVGLVTTLERKGFIARAARAGTARTIDIELTPAGRFAYERARRRTVQFERRLRSALSDDGYDYDNLAGVLERLSAVVADLDE